MEQDSQIEKQSEENEYGEISTSLPFPKVLSQYYVPRDPEDPSYILSFSVDEPEKIKSFFNHFGFVVIRDVLSSDDCLESINEIYNIPESTGKFRRDDINTWDDKSWPKDAMLKHGMPCKAPIFTTQFLKNRQNPNVHKAFSIVLGIEDLLVSHDRASFLRPTKSILFNGQIQDMKHWKTSTNIHMDMGPWDYIHNPQRFENALGTLEYGIQHLNQFIFENNQIMSTVNNGLHVQGVLNLADNVESDGGFQIVPGFKNHFAEWVKINQGTELQKIADERGSVPISDNDALQAYTTRVPMRAGSIVIWDQRSPHGAVTNDSSRPRMAQFIKMFPAKPINPVRANKRRDTIMYMCKKANFFPHLTILGAKLFDLPESLAQAKPKVEEKKKKNRVQGAWSTKP